LLQTSYMQQVIFAIHITSLVLSPLSIL
jgi:hypothetical protein